MIKLRNLCIWLQDQICRKRLFYNFFVSRNAWGAFSRYSHIRRDTETPKVAYRTKEVALKAADKMSSKYGKHFSAYKCLFCDGYHLGKNKDNK